LIIRNSEFSLSLNEGPHFAWAAKYGVSQLILSSAIKQSEEDVDVLIENQPIRIICLSHYLLGAVL